MNISYLAANIQIKQTGLHNIFHLDGECHVIYDKNNPDYSYIKQSGQYIRCIVGILFAMIGIGVLLLGIFLITVL